MMRTFRTRRLAAAAAGALALTAASGCKDYLDVNTNPNAPTSVAANLYLAPMLHWMVTSPQYDGRFIGRYTQAFMVPTTTPTPTSWDRMGYDPASDAGGQQWRDVYWTLGQNLVDMTNKAQGEQRYDLLGVAQILKAWGWQATTDVHGEIIIKEAFDPTRSTFDYDPQELAYTEARRLLYAAIANLRRTDGAVDPTYLAKGDVIYKGDRTKWRKLAFAMLALNLNHYSNKRSYQPDSVIAAVDSAFTGNADDPLLSYTAQSPDNADFSFLGRTRGNFQSYRQTVFVVNLMNGTTTGGVVDPRMSRMLAPSGDGVYRGVDPNFPNSALTLASNPQAPYNLYGYPGAGGSQQPGRYLFSDRAKLPAVVTYAVAQFIKAEAALRKGDASTALIAYRNGVSAHIDWVNDRNRDDNQNATQISAAEKAAYLAAPQIVPANPASLTLSQIMTQKYIALWGWGWDEQWMDMRRYHYTDADPKTGAQVYPGFQIPSNLYPDNAGKPVYRIRPRYNSEYVWNQAGLSAIGGLALDYHTKPLWIINP